MFVVVIVEQVMSLILFWLFLHNWGVTSIGVQGQTHPQLSIFLTGIFWPDARQIGMQGTMEEIQAKQRRCFCPRGRMLQEPPVSEPSFRLLVKGPNVE